MGYLVCEKCGGYYELQEDESIDDFQSCQCGGKLKYVKNLNQLNTESNKHEKISVCSFCCTENLKDDKFCGNCGKPLNATVSSELPPKAKTKITDRISKYQNKRNYSFFAIGIIGIGFIAFLILWLPGTVFANHYDDGVVSFDYPSNFNVTKGQNTSYLIDSGSYDGTVTKVHGGIDPDKDKNGNYYDIFITMSPMNINRSVPVNQSNGLNSTGNGIATQNVTTKNETENILQKGLDEIKAAGIEIKKSTKNGYTYYEIEELTSNSKWSNTTKYRTIIQKDGTPFFFIIDLQIYYNDKKNFKEGMNAYKQIITTFKINTV